MLARRTLLLSLSILSVLLPACSTRSDPRLRGEWVSNRELTIATIKPHIGHLPKELQGKFLDIFGRMRVTWGRGQVSIFMPKQGDSEDWSHTTGYRVIGRTKHTVTTQAEDWPYGENKPETAHFVSKDRYWVAVNLASNKAKEWREYFDRVKQ